MKTTAMPIRHASESKVEDTFTNSVMHSDKTLDRCGEANESPALASSSRLAPQRQAHRLASSRSMRQSKPAAMVSMAVAMLQILCFISSSTCVGADWIDPDTPSDVRFTQPYTPRVPSLNQPQSSTEISKKKRHRRRYFLNMTTASPTQAPTVSAEPSQSPTTNPSAMPTSVPDTFELVFSDEFNVPMRSFEDGADPRWTAMEKNDYTNDALHYYSADNARTDAHGHLVITTEAKDTAVVGFDDITGKNVRVTKHFKSAMIQSWNKFCFTGGIIEANVTLPGKHNVGGLWPAFWILGNLARHTYVGSSAHVWPWSSTVCTEKSFESQLISACDEAAHYGLRRGIGRGAPEVDIFEVQPGNTPANQGPFLKSPVGQPFMSASFQVAPGRPNQRPGPGWWPGPGQWYDGLTGGNKSALNIGFYGTYNHFRSDPNPKRSDYWSDAISYNRQLDQSHFNSSHVYRLEWDVPTDKKDGYLRWFIDGELVLSINGTGIKDAGLGSSVTSEPSYIIMNTAVSSQWGFPKCPTNCPCKDYDCNSNDYQNTCGFSDGFCSMMKSKKPEYKIDWVRVYQNPNNPEQKVGCSTPERPTRQYILAHEKLYKTAKDERPLRGIAIGRGACNPYATGESSDACGGKSRGRCTGGKVCECNDGWVGPHCLASDGSNPIQYDTPDTIADVGFVPPKAGPFRGLLVALVVLIVGLTLSLTSRNRMEGWAPIPDVDMSKTSRN